MRYFFALILSLSSLSAATLNVPGSYSTVQAAINAAQPGDTVQIAAGTYLESTSTARNGTALLPITIQGAGDATVIRRLSVEHSYHIVQSLKLSGTTAQYSSQLFVDSGGDFNVFRNVKVDAQNAFKVYGIAWNGDTTTDGSDNVLENCIVENVWAYPMVSMSGSRNVMKNCNVRNGYDVDFLRLFGHANIIKDNIFENNLYTPPAWGESLNHPDFIQTFGNNGGKSYEHIIERNIIRNLLNAQISQLSATGQPDIRDWTFRNNIYINTGNGGSCTMQGVEYYNNIFYRANVVSKGHALNFGNRKYGWDTGLDPAHPLRSPVDYTRNPTLSGNLVAEGDGGVYQYGGYYDVVTAEVPVTATLTVGRFYKVRSRGTARVVYNSVQYNNGQTFEVVPGVTSWSKFATVDGDLSSIELYLNAQLTYNGTVYGRDTYFQVDPAVRTFTTNYPDAVFAYRVAVDKAHRTIVKNNVFLDCGDPVNNTNGWYSIGTDLTGVGADNNYVGKNGFTPMRLRAGSIPVGGPGDWGGKGWYEPNGINGGDPGFADFSTGDFRPQSGASALVDQGAEIAGVDVDFAGDPRPRGAATDIGAYEYAGSGQIINEYYVSTTGSDAAAGTEAAPWRTIQYAVTTAAAGKPIYVAPGTYNERVTTARNGTSAARVRIIADGGVVSMKGFIVNHSYVTLDGITITGYSGATNEAAHIIVGSGGDSLTVKNCTINGGRTGVFAAAGFASAHNYISCPGGGVNALGLVPGDTIWVGDGVASQVLDATNEGTHTVVSATDTQIYVATDLLTSESGRTLYITASNQYAVHFNSGATDCIIEDSTFSNLGYDCWFIGGSRHTFRRNTVTGVGGWDILHLGGADHIIRDNHFVDSPLVVYQVSPDAWENYSPSPYSNCLFQYNVIKNFGGVIMSQKGSGTATGLQIKNNVFIDVSLMVLTHPNTTIQNNTFLRVAKTSSSVVSRSNYAIYVNETATATGVSVINNAFIDCGEPAGVDTTATVGWYGGVGLSSFIASGNFAASASPGWGAKVGWPESNPALNGGNPGFVDISNPLGVDGLAFTDDDGLRLAVGSKLIGAGNGGADVGAYGVVSSLPPAAPTGLTSIAIGSSGVSLSWTDESNNETSFEISRSGDNVSWVPTNTIPADIEQWVINGLIPSTTYYWRMRAVNAFGQSAWSSSTGTTTAAAPPVKSRNPRTNQGIPQ